MQTTLLDQGITLMLVGMGTVFVFLSLLVMAMTGMASLIKHLGVASEEIASDEEVAAITAAIAMHRRNHS